MVDITSQRAPRVTKKEKEEAARLAADAELLKQTEENEKSREPLDTLKDPFDDDDLPF